MTTCTCCEGKKTAVIKAVTVTSNGYVNHDPVTVPCIWCDGKGVMTPEEVEIHKMVMEYENQ